MYKVFDVVIVGTGFSAISAAINLKQLKLDEYEHPNFIMLERRSFPGGTWLQNRYPGAAVDVQSVLYSLEDEPYAWTEMFAKQPELAAYTNDLLNKHKLHKHIRLQHNLEKAVWLEDENYWLLEVTHNGEKLSFRSRIVINATGPLSTPSLPFFENMEAYKGKVFHSNDWPKDLELEGKKIAIIGSGASAIQIIPAIIDKVKRMDVFQRTPHWVMPRKDRVLSRIQINAFKNKYIYKSIKSIIYAILELRVIGFKYIPSVLKLLAEMPAKKHLKSQVSDLGFREKLTPSYKIGCKRILLSNTYYPALQKVNCVLHDIEDSVAAFYENGIVSKTKNKIEVDIVVLATGYRAADSMVSSEVIGRNNIVLNEQWKEYPRAYLGTSMPNFPNYFVVTGPNTGIGHTSAIFVIESQMRYIKQALNKLLNDKCKSIEPTVKAESKYSEMIHSEMDKTVWAHGGCKSWYQNENGKVIAMFPGFSFTYRLMCKKWRDDDHVFKY
ncbi:NAD(P)/FAD-dependent oxidoreductase [Glaciecola sp. KUL10]|uniref:flavin-containing monooxygenase n=1 Tax=Glaciecola sp. (strain KUL10) TaxID=2161813 RepID=UPI000D784F04|nr:NAD(P)/FAD-dependent oxidoreductase [Glaciecola sp. KUL10]GBL02902.1 flavin-containing monooxygenase FMO [Glaciecola sp. KUL10]